MTREEKIALLRQRQNPVSSMTREEKIALLRSQSPTPPPSTEGIKTEIPSQNQPLMDEPLGIAPVTGRPLDTERFGGGDQVRAVREGLTLGWGDEAEAGVSSLLGRGSYEDEQERISGTQKQFAAENPKTALGLNVAGGLMTAPFTGGGGGLLRTMGRMGAEGALTGAGMGDAGERGTGAAIGGVLGAGMGGLAKSAGGLIKKRLEGPLRRITGEGKDKVITDVPYTVQAQEENVRGVGTSFMDSIVRNLPKSPLADQEINYATKMVPQIEKRMADAVTETVDTNQAAKKATGYLKQSIERNAENLKQEASERAQQSQYRIGDVAKRRAAAAQDELDVFNTETRNMALEEAIPVSQRGKVVMTGNAQSDAQTLKEAVTRGYGEAWDAVKEGTTKEAKEAKSNVLKFANRTFDGFSGDDKSALNKMTTDVKNLYAEGFHPTQVKALDNSLRKQISAAKDKPLLRQELVSLRNNLRGSLDDATDIKLTQMDEGYGDYLTVRKAVGKASDKSGNFTPQQLATSSRMVGGESRSATGKAPLQSLVDRGQVGATKAADTTAAAAETAEAGKRFLTKAVGDKKIKITNEMRDQIERLPAAEKKAVQEIMPEFNAAKDKTAFLKRLRDNKPSLFYNLISLGAVTGLGQIPLVGPAVAYGAATKVGQRLMAGQTGAQGLARNIAGNKTASAVGNALRRGGTVGGFNYFGE